ncbi:MAG TPA: anti-sigma factor RsbA family regulatory protein [Solirubrobacteraceae bacterium]|nr:anti-sigma factor RsbA family regulatory protein [Solirubrobacteraceae bacterium]
MPLSPAGYASRASAEAHPLRPRGAFRHELFCYANGDHGFLGRTIGLVLDALAQQAGVLVAVVPARALALREALGAESGRVRFEDVHEFGRNPARMIPAWRAFIGEHAHDEGATVAIGEAVWRGRGAAEVDECERHEALLNVAFDEGQGWHLLCAYDLDRLDDGVIEAAQHTHPLLAVDGASHGNERYAYGHEPPGPFAGVLPAARGAVTQLAFSTADLAQVRSTVSAWASAQALALEPAEELVLAVDELAANSIRHGGGAGTLRCWREDDMLLCEVQDSGWIRDPLVGRVRPSAQATSGRGVWLANQLCDLVQIRSTPAGSVVRLHKRVS